MRKRSRSVNHTFLLLLMSVSVLAGCSDAVFEESPETNSGINTVNGSTVNDASVADPTINNPATTNSNTGATTGNNSTTNNTNVTGTTTDNTSAGSNGTGSIGAGTDASVGILDGLNGLGTSNQITPGSGCPALGSTGDTSSIAGLYEVSAEPANYLKIADDGSTVSYSYNLLGLNCYIVLPGVSSFTPLGNSRFRFESYGAQLLTCGETVKSESIITREESNLRLSYSDGSIEFWRILSGISTESFNACSL